MTTAIASHPPRMPEVQKVMAKAGEPDTLVLATRYGGHYVTHDGGATWFNVCHEALGSDDSETYGALFSRDGTLVASTGYRGISSSVDGCTWTEWLPPDRSFITDLAVIGEQDILALDRQEPQRIWASNALGKSFLPYGSALPEGVRVSTIAASRDGWHVYVGATSASGEGRPSLVHSSDAAESWETLPIPGRDDGTVELVGVSAGNPEVVVVRVTSPSGASLELSRDAGRTWETLFSADGALPAALLTDEDMLFVGGPGQGLWSGSLTGGGGGAPSATFERIADLGALDLTWSEGRLFAVTSQLEDGYSVAVSRDGGRTFEPFFDVCHATVNASCGADSTVMLACSAGIEQAAWQPLGNACETRTGEPDAPAPPPKDADAFVDAPASASCGVGSGRASSRGEACAMLAAGFAMVARLKGKGRARYPRSRRGPS